MRNRITLFAAVVAAVIGLAAPPTAAIEPTYGGLTAVEWQTIAAHVGHVEPTYGGLTAAEWQELAAVYGTARPTPTTSAGWVEQLRPTIDAAAAEFGVSPLVLSEIGRCEMDHRGPRSVNRSSGALGFGQHLPRYWPGRAAAIGLPPDADPLDATNNIRVTAWLLATSGTAPWARWSGHCSAAY